MYKHAIIIIPRAKYHRIKYHISWLAHLFQVQIASCGKIETQPYCSRIVGKSWKFAMTCGIKRYNGKTKHRPIVDNSVVALMLLNLNTMAPVKLTASSNDIQWYKIWFFYSDISFFPWFNLRLSHHDSGSCFKARWFHINGHLSVVY